MKGKKENGSGTDFSQNEKLLEFVKNMDGDELREIVLRGISKGKRAKMEKKHISRKALMRKELDGYDKIEWTFMLRIGNNYSEFKNKMGAYARDMWY